MAIKFREKALLKLKSPEQLDEPLHVMWQKRRLGYATFLYVMLLALFWGIFGSLPKSDRGQGILMTPDSIVPIQAQADGQIAQWFIKVGDVVEKGMVVGLLEQPVIAFQFVQERDKLQEVLSKKRAVQLLRSRYTQLEKSAIQRQRETLKGRIEYLKGYIERAKAFATQINDYNAELLGVQKQNLGAAKNAADQLTQEWEQRLESFKRLRTENLASDDTLRSVRLRYENSKLKMRDLELQNRDLDATKVQTAQAFLDARNLLSTNEHSLTQLNLQLQELDNREAQLDKQDSESAARDQNEIDDIRRALERHQKQLQRDRDVTAEYSGRVIEITAVEGSVVTFGQRLVQLDTRKDTDELVALTYFQDKVGKHLHPGLPVRVSPLTLDQKRFGSIRGEIVSVSAYPVTAESVVNAVGNQEVATKLAHGGFQIEVFVKLQTDPTSPSGFAWTSRRGPDVELTSGTTADVWVTYEDRAPISFILPKLREWSGLALSPKLGTGGNE